MCLPLPGFRPLNLRLLVLIRGKDEKDGVEALLSSPQHGAVCSEPLESNTGLAFGEGCRRAVSAGPWGTVCASSAATQVGTSTRMATCWIGGVTSQPSTSANSRSAWSISTATFPGNWPATRT